MVLANTDVVRLPLYIQHVWAVFNDFLCHCEREVTRRKSISVREGCQLSSFAIGYASDLHVNISANSSLTCDSHYYIINILHTNANRL